MRAVERIQIVIGVAALSMGLMVYLYDRPPGSVMLLEAMGAGAVSEVGLFGSISGQLPAFIHVFAFALLTTGLLGCRSRGAFFVCMFWLVINVLFELGQVVENSATTNGSGAFNAIFGPGVLGEFFRSGTFDPLDLLAMALGAIAAFIVCQITMQRRGMP